MLNISQQTANLLRYANDGASQQNCLMVKWRKGPASTVSVCSLVWCLWLYSLLLPSSDEPVAGETEALSVAAEPLIGEAELPGSNRFVESNETDVKIRSGGQRLSTVVEASSDFVASENDSTVTANVSESSETSDRDETAQYPPTPERAESEKKKADAEDGGRPKPALKPKPEVKPKPAIAQKPVLLPKPKLLSKPDEPYHFSGLHAFPLYFTYSRTLFRAQF